MNPLLAAFLPLLSIVQLPMQGYPTSWPILPAYQLGSGVEVMLAGALGGITAQSIKIVGDVIRERNFNFKRVVETGGMPSSHSASMMSLATSVGLNAGFDSVVFAVALGLALVVMYDAAGVRRAAGKMAGILNQLLSDLYQERSERFPGRLKELLGHTPVEVLAGLCLGIVVAVAVHGSHPLGHAQPLQPQALTGLPNGLIATPNPAICEPSAQVLARTRSPGDWIKVGLSDNPMTAQQYPSTLIASTTPYRVCTAGANPTEFRAAAGQKIKISANGQGFWLSVLPQDAPKGLVNKPFGPLPAPLTIETIDPKGLLSLPAVTRQGQVPHYRGFFEVVQGNDPSKLMVVNSLPMQDYLRAVVPNELPARYGLEAIRAQAVAARNYAVRPREKFWSQFDLCDSQYCQAYYGAQTETPETDRALTDTTGLFALYQGEPILALYSSSNGGYSEDYSNAFSDPKTRKFPAPPLLYLKGRPDSVLAVANLKKEADARKFWSDADAPGLEQGMPNYRWRFVWSRGELEKQLNRTLAEVSNDGSTQMFVSPRFGHGHMIGQLKNITVLERGVSGKAMAVKISGSRGSWTVQKEFVIRKLFAPPVMAGKPVRKMLPSANVVFTLNRAVTSKKAKTSSILSVVAYGGGFGHGVGMSQLGASTLSMRGQTFPSILQYFYHGISIGSYPLTVGKQMVSASFYVHNPQGAVLRIQHASDPISELLAHLKINQQEVTVPLKAGAPLSTVDIGTYLNPDTLNTLTLLPQNNPTGGYKAWVDVVSPKP